MSTQPRSLVLALVLLAGASLAGCADPPAGSDDLGDAEQALSDSACPDDVPGTLAPSVDQRLFFVLHGVGDQIYACRPAGSGYAWTLKAPAANLLDNGGDVVGTHYAGPTWQYEDGSSVVGTRVAAAPSPDPNAIPWLLLTGSAHSGDGKMANVTSIQRLSTAGGKAPATGCDAAHAGAEVNIPYTADYFFYKAGHGNNDSNVRCGD